MILGPADHRKVGLRDVAFVDEALKQRFAVKLGFERIGQRFKTFVVGRQYIVIGRQIAQHRQKRHHALRRSNLRL